MATGTVWYWNGLSGWIKQSDVAELPTNQARDVMILANAVISGTVDQNSAVTFTIDQTSDPWLARNVEAS
jgi:hypothetical protein